MRNCSALVFLLLACCAAALHQNIDKNDVLKTLLEDYKPAAGTDARSCETQYQELLENYSDRLIQYVHYFMLSVGYDPTTMPVIQNYITATDLNFHTWNGTIVYYNTFMYDNSKFETVTLILDCAADFLNAKLFLSLEQMKTRGRFKLDIANAQHYGYIEGAMDSFLLMEYSMNYKDFTVNKDFQIIDKGYSNLTVQINYQGGVIDWTFDVIKQSMSNTFLDVYSIELRELLRVSIDDAIENTKVVQ